MGHYTREEGIKAVNKGLLLLAVVTLIEVGFSLFGKGYIIGGVEEYTAVLIIVGLALIFLSLYKARYIVFKFMHMEDEVSSLKWSVIAPMLLFVWAIIAFFNEGSSWLDRREQILEKNRVPATEEFELSLQDEDEPGEVYTIK